LSQLRNQWTRRDVRVAHLLRFARQYHGKAFRFLTLTTRPDQAHLDLPTRLKVIIRFLRRDMKRLDYLATRTDEGLGVYHLVLISSAFIPIRKIQAFWGARCWITREHEFNGLLLEMTQQREIQRYSMSRGFLPDGAGEAIEALSRHFRGHEGMIARAMLARRWKRGNALHLTRECCFRKGGWGCDLKTRSEINVRMRG